MAKEAANGSGEKQSDVIRLIETKDTGNPRAAVYNRIAERRAAGAPHSQRMWAGPTPNRWPSGPRRQSDQKRRSTPAVSASNSKVHCADIHSRTPLAAAILTI
jgi:hypothetical protein